MLDDWIETTIGEQATLQRGFDITKAEQRPGTVPVVSSGGISSYHDKVAVRRPGVVLGRKGVVGSVYFIDVDYWPHDTTLWVKNFHGNDPRFVYYFFKNFAPCLLGLDVGSANPTLNRNHVHPIQVLWPQVPEQRAIARILGTLDDKIELNSKTNQTLEAMARIIFKSWFVDFDPVKAKTSGESAESICRRLGLTLEILSLFPDGFEESKLGEIPSGWKVKGLDDVANYLNGLALQKYPVHGTKPLPIVKIAQLRAGHTNGADCASSEIPEEYVITDGDVLFSWSGSLEVEIWCGGPGALNQHLFKVTSDKFPKWFYYLWTKHHLPSFRDIAANKATTMGHIQRRHLSEAKVLVPSPDLIKEMNSFFKPIIENMIIKNIESRTLASLRDTLLPKLLSGKIRVKFLEEA